MPKPTIIATYSTDFSSANTTKSVDITCEQGDTLIIYTMGQKNAICTTPTSTTSLIFDVYSIKNGSSTTGLTNVYACRRTPKLTGATITVTESTGTLLWGFTCVVARNVSSIDPISGGSLPRSGGGPPSTSPFVQYPNTLFLALAVDTAPLDGASRIWRTVNGQTPSANNGMELTYSYNPGVYTAYAAYYDDTVPGGTISVGLSSPTPQTYYTLNIPLIGYEAPQFEVAIGIPYATNTLVAQGAFISPNLNRTLLIAAAFVGVRPINGADSSVTTTATYGNRPLTSIAKVHSNNGTQGYVEIFYMVNPPSGNQTLDLRASQSVDMAASATVVSNVDQGNPIAAITSATGSSTNASVTVNNTDSRNAVFVAMVSGNNITSRNNSVQNGQSQLKVGLALSNFNNSSDGGCAASQIISMPATSQSLGWTITDGPWAAIAVTLNSTSYFPPGAMYGFKA